MFKCLAAFLALMTVFLHPVQAAEIRKSFDTECRVQITGEIEKGDAAALAEFSDHLIVDNGESTIASVVCLDSPGGNIREGKDMAKFILQNGIGTRIRADRECSSVCAVMFMMGNYRGGEVAGLSRRMHYSSKLGFHRPSLKIDEAQLYTSDKLASIYTLGMETIFEYLKIANRREPWGNAQMIEPDLLQFIVGTPKEDMFYVSTVEEVLRWRIDVDGLPNSSFRTSNQLHYACENALANPISLTSVLNGNDGLLGDAVFQLQPLNKYSIEAISGVGNVGSDGALGVASLRAGYSSVGCRVQLAGGQVAICGEDETTDTQIGRCGEEYGMRYFSPLSVLHPKTHLRALGLPDTLNADARRIAQCETSDLSGNLTDSQECLHDVALLHDAGSPLARHFFTWPSGSRTVIDIEGALSGESHARVRINGGNGKIIGSQKDRSCIFNLLSGNVFCVRG